MNILIFISSYLTLGIIIEFIIINIMYGKEKEPDMIEINNIKINSNLIRWFRVVIFPIVLIILFIFAIDSFRRYTIQVLKNQ